jgi:hypothetical protein
MSIQQPDLKLIRILTDRLERISADSIWAHRASGVRGALLRILDQAYETYPPDPSVIADTISTAFKILERAAKRN